MNADDDVSVTDTPAVPPSGFYCPCCADGPFDDLTAHWRQADECTPPFLTPQQRAIAHGVLLAGGTLVHEGSEAYLTVETDSELFARWLASAFGVNTAAVVERAGEYRWRSRAVAPFTELCDDWLDETGAVSPPARIPTTPDTVRTAYALTGVLRDVSSTPRPVFTPQPASSVAAIERVCGPFHPMTFAGATGDEVYVQATDEFFQYIGAPLPDCESKWPGRVTVLDTAPDRCPHCLNEFEFIEAHWRAGVTCSPPLLSWKQHEFAEGALLGGGKLERAEGGHRLAVPSVETDIATGLDETFGVLSAGVHETEEGPVWYSRATPELSRFTRWLDTDGRMRIPSDLHHSERMLKLAYGLAGEFVDDRPKFRFPHPIESDAFAEGFFEEFDPMSTPSGVVLRDVSAFFQYVGWIPLPGCVSKWPR